MNAHFSMPCQQERTREDALCFSFSFLAVVQVANHSWEGDAPPSPFPYSTSHSSQPQRPFPKMQGASLVPPPGKEKPFLLVVGRLKLWFLWAINFELWRIRKEGTRVSLECRCKEEAGTLGKVGVVVFPKTASVRPQPWGIGRSQPME